MIPEERIEIVWYRSIRRGAVRGWYWQEGNRIDAIGHAHGIPGPWAIGAASALSPMIEWERARGVLLQAALHGEYLPTTTARARKALAILAGVYPDPLTAFDPTTAPKTRAFFLNLSGDVEAVTVDRHAFAIAGIQPGSIGRYRRAAAAYVSVASALGETPCDVQAITWQGFRDLGVALPSDKG